MGKIISIFMIRGFWLWLLCGGLTGMICVRPFVPIEQIKDNQEALKEYSEVLGGIVFKTSAIWAICGAVMGFLVWLIFTLRPSYEHQITMSRAMPSSSFGQGPKTLAEIKAMFIIIPVSLLFVFLVFKFLLPLTLVSQQVLELNPDKGPLIVSCVQTVILTILILPFSLKKIEKL